MDRRSKAAARLRQWIIDSGHSYQDVADLIGDGCSRQYVRQIAVGEAQLSSITRALRIEELTRSWRRGPITVAEWAR